MKRIPLACITTIIVAIIGCWQPRTAGAQTGCYGGLTWTQNSVPLYISNHTTYGLQNLGFSITIADYLARRAVAIWSERTGSPKRIGYLGITSATQLNNAIVVSMLPTKDPDGASALAITQNVSTGGIANYSTIQFYQKNDDGVVRNWQYSNDLQGTSDTSPEFISVMLHELGHAFARLMHPGTGGCFDSGQVTIMRSPRSYGAEQTIRDQDKLNVEAWYGRRSTSSSLYRRHWEPSTSSWSGITVSSHARYVLTRMSSTSQNYAWSTLTWLTSDDPGVSGIRLKKTVYTPSGFFYPEVAPVESRSPSGIAINPINGEAMWVYLKPGALTNKYKEVCYRFSTNAGQSFGTTEYCTGFNNVQRDFVAVGYDPRSSTFIIGWVNDIRLLQFLTVPSSGSSVPGAGTVLNNPTAWFGPTIACRDASNGCRIAYGSADEAAGCFKWIETQVNLVDGTIGSGTVRTNCYLMHDAPSIVYFQHDDTFRRVFTQGNGASYGAVMTATGTTWQGMPDVYNVGTVHSPAVYSTERFCFFGCGGTLRAWFPVWSVW